MDFIAAMFPLINPNPVRCGNRADLPRKQRRHAYVCLGPDARHMGDGSFQDVWVRACLTCGLDKYQRQPPVACATGCVCLQTAVADLFTGP